MDATINTKSSTSCVFACSGPSLNKVDPFSLGLPVIAISTAIRKIPNPDYWVYSDYINEMHGLEGKAAFENPNILKITQKGKERGYGAMVGKNITSYECELTNRHYDRSNVFNPGKIFSKGPHKSVSFGIQWAHSVGFKNIIFCGNDLQANSLEEKYCYPVQSFDIKKKHNFKRTLDEVQDYMRDWYPIATEKGYRWFSWECGSVFDGMVEKLTPEVISVFSLLSESNTVINTNVGEHISIQEPNIRVPNEIMDYHELMKIAKNI